MTYKDKSHAVRVAGGKQLFQLAFQRRPGLEPNAKTLATQAAAQMNAGLSPEMVAQESKAEWKRLLEE